MTKMTAPTSGVKVRMYRQGHGDCFLLAFAGEYENHKTPVYVLIDCGLKPGSEIHDQDIDKVIASIGKATNNHIDIVIVTHEHQDHVNGFSSLLGSSSTKKNFDAINIGQVWLAWTENPKDRFANQIRDKFNDTLLTLAMVLDSASSARLNSDDQNAIDTIEEMLDFEVEGADEAGNIVQQFNTLSQGLNELSNSDINRLVMEGGLAAEKLDISNQVDLRKVKGKRNKAAIRYLIDKSDYEPLYLRPDRGPYPIDWVEGVKAYALGPPRSTRQLLDLDPHSGEEFHLGGSLSDVSIDSTSSVFESVNSRKSAPKLKSPFQAKYVLTEEQVFQADDPVGMKDSPESILKSRYGANNDSDDSIVGWRKISSESIGHAERLALRLNNEVNNTSLVLAFELPETGKVLLFTGDAQRGSWISWKNLSWSNGNETVNVRDLLAKCVLYKVGHHGSHNATLNGFRDDSHPNLTWFAHNEYADEFVAMIPANEVWAKSKSKPWQHPQSEIADALSDKANGKIFQSDIDKVKRSPRISSSAWRKFKEKKKEKDLYFEYTVTDDWN